jgi:DNA-binding response OmpR family regulator
MPSAENGERAKILVVEDEHHLAAGLKLNFELEGHQTRTVSSARAAALAMVEDGGFDVIVLDVMLPDSDGFEFCRRLRDAGDRTPVLMLTALGHTEDRVRGLEVGADDYLVKPFALEELLARVRSLLRRRKWVREVERVGVQDPPLRLGDTWIDFGAREVRVDPPSDREIHLTQLEFDLLLYFVRNPSRVLTRQELQEQVWKLDNYSNSRMVDNFILRLRKHFEANPAEPKYFVSVRGTGYKFVPPS